MRDFARKFLSHDCGPFAQFVKYGAVGVMATCVHLAVFYLLASTCLKCLTEDDKAVRLLSLPFTVANVFCWLMNRAFVFRPGKFAWHVEFALFYGAAALATVIALVVQSALIRFAGMTTSFAAILEIVVSFFVNFVTRRFFIFKG